MLSEIFGKNARTKIIEALIEANGKGLTKTEIAKKAEIGWSTLYEVWKELENKKIVKVVRKVGNARLYSLNKEKEYVRKIMELEKTLKQC